MPKSYDDQIEELQKKISALKTKKAEAKKNKEAKIGLAVTDQCPEILTMMDEKEFNIFEFVKTKEFAKMLFPDFAKEENPQPETKSTSDENSDDISSDSIEDSEDHPDRTGSNSSGYGYENY